MVALRGTRVCCYNWMALKATFFGLSPIGQLVWCWTLVLANGCHTQGETLGSNPRGVVDAHTGFGPK